MNVNLPIARHFDALGRTDRFYDMLKLTSKKISDDLKHAMSSRAVSLTEFEFDKLRHKIKYVVGILRTVEELGQCRIDFKKICEESEQASELIEQILEKLQNAKNGSTENNSSNHRQERFNNEIYHLRRIVQICLRWQTKY